MPDFKLTLLQNARIASPCPVRWEDMRGDDKTRHCAQCNLHVHNLSAMTDQEAEDLLGHHFNPSGAPLTPEFCAGFFRRADGTILTRDCPVGLARIRARARRALARCVIAIGTLASSAAALGLIPVPPWRTDRLRERQPFRRVAEWIDPAGAPALAPMVKGKMAVSVPRGSGGAAQALPAQVPQGGNNAR